MASVDQFALTLIGTLDEMSGFQRSTVYWKAVRAGVVKPVYVTSMVVVEALAASELARNDGSGMTRDAPGGVVSTRIGTRAPTGTRVGAGAGAGACSAAPAATGTRPASPTAPATARARTPMRRLTHPCPYLPTSSPLSRLRQWQESAGTARV